MNIHDLKSRLLIATLVTGVGLVILLFSKKINWVAGLDFDCAIAASSHESTGYLVHDIDPDSHTLTIRTLAAKPEKGRSFQIVQITDDPDRIFEHSPPSALDYAIILESLRNRGYRDVVLTTRMNWTEQSGLETKGLTSRLALFEHSVIPLPVALADTPQPLPTPLKRALIPFSQVSGNHQLIPLVNQVPLATHADGGDHTLAGFCQIENAFVADGQMPLLAHWQDQGLIPSIELLAVMTAHNTSPADLIIHCSKHIRLGKDGPVIPIDDYGQTASTRTKPSTPSPAPLKADQLITPTNANRSTSDKPTQTHIALIHAVGKKTSTTNTLSAARLASLLALSQTHPAVENPSHIPRLPLWAAIILIIDIALITCWFASFTRAKRHIAYLLTAACIFLLLLALIDLTQHWFGLSAPLATLITAWVMPVLKPKLKFKFKFKPKRRKTVSSQQYTTSGPRPIIRP